METVRTILEQEYGLDVLEQREAGGSSVVVTNQGDYYLYRVGDASRQKRRWIERVGKLIGKQPGLSVLPVTETKAGRRLADGDAGWYYLQPAVGESALADQAYTVGQSLAKFHQATANSPADSSLAAYRSLGNWPVTWRKNLYHFDRYREQVEAEGSELRPFDICLIMNYTYITQMANTAIQYLVDHGYQKVVKETAKQSKVAYQNFDDGFLFPAADGQLYLGGIYNWTLDMRSRDIGQWLKAQSRRHGWHEQTAQSFLAGYNSVTPLLDEEYAVIYALMMYPGRVLRQAALYDQLDEDERGILPQQSWTKQVEDELTRMEGALRGYRELIIQQFGVIIPEVEWLLPLTDDEEWKAVKERAAEETTV